MKRKPARRAHRRLDTIQTVVQAASVFVMALSFVGSMMVMRVVWEFESEMRVAKIKSEGVKEYREMEKRLPGLH